MIKLSRKNIGVINKKDISKPSEKLFDLPEKILQFGTGVLLRGLCDYLVHDANTKGIFNGRIVMVKSTDAGDTSAYAEQDNLYTVCIRGVEDGKIVKKNVICSAISRVLSAKEQWNDVLQTVYDPNLRIIISNTTEVGLQLVKENVREGVPSSFPGKLLAVLLSRFEHFGGNENSRMVVIPTELISENGEKLHAIVRELAVFNHTGGDFLSWLDEKVTFCNSLVDRIVTKDPGQSLFEEIRDELGYEDDLLTMCEDYALWAIEGGPEVEEIVSFAKAGTGSFVKPDIDIYKFLKLHLLNGTHTLSASLAFLAGFDVVKDAMADVAFSKYVQMLMQNDIARAIPYKIDGTEIKLFSIKVLDRFRNPYLQHKWINITLHNTMKMRNRNVPVILKHKELNNGTPSYIATGFAGYLLFMKAVESKGNIYYGSRNGELYAISDDQATYFYNAWQNATSPDKLVDAVLSNTDLWGADLSSFTPFAEEIKKQLNALINDGVLKTIQRL